MQKQLRIGFLLVLLLLVVETARLMMATLDHIEIKVVAVKQPPVVELLHDALGVTPTGRPASTIIERSTSLPSGGITIQKSVPATTSPTPLASTPTYRPSPDPTASPTPTATLQPYRTVVSDRKQDRQATRASTAIPAESSPAQPTNSPPEGNPASPTKQPPSMPTSAPGALPTSAPVEPPTPESPPLPTSAP